MKATQKDAEKAANEFTGYEINDDHSIFIKAFLAGCEFEAQNRWISVYKEAPDYMQTCIICDHLGIVLMAQYSGDGNIFMLDNTTYIANEWMPLPSPPKPQEL